MKTRWMAVLALVLAASCTVGLAAKKGKGKGPNAAGGPAIKGTITIGGREYEVRLTPVPKPEDGKKPKRGGPATVTVAGKQYRVRIIDPNAPAGAKKAGGKKGGPKKGPGKRAGGKKGKKNK